MVGQTEKKKYTFSAKANATKEVTSWGRDYGSLADPTMRSAGQLTENVTEARMLQTKIMDMSRERYKYITQADFNMKFFLEGQKRKARLMPQLLHGVDVQYWLSKKTARHVPTYTSSSSNARFAFLERLESSGQKCKDFEEEEEENPFAIQERPKKPEKQLPEFYRIRLKEQEEEELAKTTFPTQPAFRPATHKTVKFCPAEKDNLKLPEVPQSSKPGPSNQVTVSAPSAEQQVIKRDEIKEKQRAKSVPLTARRSVEDPRYQGLERSLSSGVYITRIPDPSLMQSIIQAQDSLHVPSKHSTVNSKPKVQRTILEYLRSKGFNV